MKALFLVIALFYAVSSIACTEGLFDGKYILPDENAVVILPDGRLQDNKWDSFNLFDPDSERPEGGKVTIQKNLPFEIKQIGCEELVVRHQKLSNSWMTSAGGRFVTDLKLVEESLSLEPFVDLEEADEKVSWTANSFTVKSKVGNMIGWRKYKITATKNADGSIDVKYNGGGFAPLPAPIPVYWKNSYKLIPVL